MIIKTFDSRKYASIKRIAMNVNPLVTKKNKIAEKINKLNREYNDLCSEIDEHESWVKKFTGYSSEDLIIRKVIEGEKAPKWEPNPKYITYNEENKCYELHSEDVEVEEVNSEAIDDSVKVPEIEITGENPYINE